MNKHLKYFIIFFVLAILISLIYYYFANFWNFANSEPFLKKYLVSTVEDFVYSIGSSVVIGILIITGLILTLIFIFLAIYEIFKFLKFSRKNKAKNILK